jgi:hypothetical protein
MASTDLSSKLPINLSTFVESTHAEITDEYRANEDLDAEFRSDLEKWKEYYAVTFRGIDLAREAIRLLTELEPKEVWIDTEYGWVLRGDQFLQALQQEPSWDWRYTKD